MKNKFQNMTNYTAVCQVTPDVYGFINTVTILGEEGSKEVYRMPKTVQYVTAYTPIRDRMYMGMHAAYIEIVKQLSGKPLNNGDLKYYWMVMVETGNDKPRRIISFDAYILQCNDYDTLITTPEFNKIPGINDKDIHSAVFILGKQYTGDMKTIDSDHLLFHIKAYKHTPVRIEKFNLDEDLVFDFESEQCQKFLQSAFTGTDRNLYSIGIEAGTHNLFDNIDETSATPSDNEPREEYPKEEATSQEPVPEEHVYRDPGNILGQFTDDKDHKEIEVDDEDD